MQRQLRLLVEANAKSHTAGADLATRHSKAYGELLISVRDTAKQLQGSFAPAIEKIEFAATRAGLAFGGLTTAVAALVGAGAGLGASFQGHAQNLTRMREATGLTVDSLRTFEALGARVGASSEQMDQGLRSVTDRMEQMRRFPQAAAAGMQSAGFLPNLRNEVLALKNLNPEAQLKGILDIAERIRKTPGQYGGQRHEKEFLAYMGLPENLADYPGRIGELVAKIRGELGHMTEGQIAAGNESAEAWQGLQTRLAALSDTIGSKFVPMLNNAYDSMSKLEGSATAWASAIKIDPSVTAAWDDVSKRIGADVKSIVAGLSSFDDLASRPRVLPLSVAPEWRGFAEDIKNLAGDAGNVVKLVDGLNQAKINWAEIFNLAGMTDQVEKIRAAGAAFEAMLEKWLPGYKRLQQTKNAPKEAAKIPGVGHLLDKPRRPSRFMGGPLARSRLRRQRPRPSDCAWWSSRTSRRRPRLQHLPRRWAALRSGHTRRQTARAVCLQDNPTYRSIRPACPSYRLHRSPTTLPRAIHSAGRRIHFRAGAGRVSEHRRRHKHNLPRDASRRSRRHVGPDPTVASGEESERKRRPIGEL